MHIWEGSRFNIEKELLKLFAPKDMQFIRQDYGEEDDDEHDIPSRTETFTMTRNQGPDTENDTM